ncbi:MAG: hypothetical protein M1828_004117 [Chrysothrix sp. TS-e1954]|nr:MAG: hypothetical protein M1828_004117 [Chrysothrix sp. TS-e1954]
MSAGTSRKRRKFDGQVRDHTEIKTADDNTYTDLNEPFARSAATWNLEAGYEQRKRQRKGPTESNRLPTKTPEGRLQHSELPDHSDGDQSMSDNSSEQLAQDTPPTDVSELSGNETESKLPLQEQILKAKEDLAKYAAQLAENPEGHISNLRGLAQIASSRNATITKLGLATQAQVYKDIIPSYRIRPLSKEDLKEKVSKEVRNLRTFEQSLVSNYHSYVRELNRVASLDRTNSSEESTVLATIATSCACSLVISVPHFNFRTELLQILVGKLSRRTTSKDFIACQQALSQLLAEDEDGKPSLEAVSLLAKMMKAKGYSVDQRVLDVFLHIRLLSEFSHRASTTSIDKSQPKMGNGVKQGKKRQWEFRNKKQRKTLREEKAIDKELREADATVSSQERDKQQGEALKLILGVYFRILKTRRPELMGATLEGLSRYAHLINQELFGDVLEALKDIVQDSNAKAEHDSQGLSVEMDMDASSENGRNTTREALLAVITAFTLLQGQDVAASASSLGLDLNSFISHLWTSIMRASLEAEIESSSKTLTGWDADAPAIKDTRTKVNIRTTIVLLLRSLHAVLLPSNTRSVPPVRTAGLTKQLMTASMHLPEKSCQATIGFVAQVLKAHRRRVATMWYTEERRGDGVFDPMTMEVESSNPFATTCFEGELLRLHYCPDIREGTSVLEELAAKTQ